MVFPKLGFLPQISHTSAIDTLLPTENFERIRIFMLPEIAPRWKQFARWGVSRLDSLYGGVERRALRNHARLNRESTHFASLVHFNAQSKIKTLTRAGVKKDVAQFRLL
jgi:hypothetical protein